MSGKNELPPAGRAIVTAGAVLGLIAACAAIFLLPVNGILTGALVGMGGPVLGVAVATLVARALTGRKP